MCIILTKTSKLVHSCYHNIYICMLNVTYFIAVGCKEILVSASEDGEIMKAKTCRSSVKDSTLKLWNIAFVEVNMNFSLFKVNFLVKVFRFFCCSLHLQDEVPFVFVNLKYFKVLRFRFVVFFSILILVSECLQKGNHWNIGFKASRGTGTGVEEDCLNTEEQRF